LDRTLHFVQGLAWTVILLPMPLSSWDYRLILPNLACWLRWSLTFCAGWPWTAILQTSASLVTGITGMYHYTQSCFSWIKI
jgi:hypothetical protein